MKSKKFIHFNILGSYHAATLYGKEMLRKTVSHSDTSFIYHGDIAQVNYKHGNGWGGVGDMVLLRKYNDLHYMTSLSSCQTLGEW